MRKKPLDRRTFLKGAGVALSLPFLEAMLPFGKSWAAEPLRFVIMYHQLGFISNEGRDAGVASELKTWHPEMLKLLQPYLQYSTYIKGLRNSGIESNHTEIPSFMANTNSGGYKFATTVDILAASILNKDCPMKQPLYIGSRYAASLSDLRNHLSQNKGAVTKMYTDPRMLFEMMTKSGRFSDLPSTPTIPVDLTKNKLKKDVLSLALGSINSLKKELGSQDKATLDQTLTSYRQAELAIEKSEKAQIDIKPSLSCTSPELAATYEDVVDDTRLTILTDLSALALNCDITRTITMMMKTRGGMETSVAENLRDKLKYPVDSTVKGYHDWSHNRWSVTRSGNGVIKYCREASRECDQWNTKEIARRFLDQLSPSMLNNSAIILGSGGKFDATHPDVADNSHRNCPFLVIGKMGGSVKPRGVTPLDLTGNEIGNVWLTLLKLMGSDLTTLGKYNPTKTVNLG